MPRIARPVAALAVPVLAVGLGSGLSGCAADVPMTPAKDANNPACAQVIVGLPDTIGGLKKRTTNAQSTGAWGDPVAVQLVCGETPSGPTTERCVDVSGVDWIIDESKAPLYRLEAYGRTPGLVVYVDNTKASGTEVVTALKSLVELLPQTRTCTSVADTIDV